MLDLLIRLLRPYSFRGKGRLLNYLLMNEREVDERIFGYRMRLDLRDHIQRNVFMGTFEAADTAILGKYLKPGMTFVDVGANVGYFTAFASSLVHEEGRVFAIEPSPYAFALLDELVRRNGIQQARPLQIGLASRSGEMTLFLPPEEEHNHSPTMVPHSEGTPVQVRVKTLDDCADDWQIDRIDLLKIDIEGYELEALRGASTLLRQRKVRAILCEFNDYWLRKAGTSPAELLRFLVSAGFHATKTSDLGAGCIVNLFLTLRD